jgi:hypothetical protein
MSGQSAAHKQVEMGYTFNQNYQSNSKEFIKAGLDSNEFNLIFMNMNLERAHIARHSRRKMR